MLSNQRAHEGEYIKFRKSRKESLLENLRAYHGIDISVPVEKLEFQEMEDDSPLKAKKQFGVGKHKKDPTLIYNNVVHSCAVVNVFNAKVGRQEFSSVRPSFTQVHHGLASYVSSVNRSLHSIVLAVCKQLYRRIIGPRIVV